MRYRVRHITRYDYARPVDLGAHMLHMRPRPLDHQAIVESSVTIDPTPTRVSEHDDFFGNRAAWVFLDRPHGKFSLTLDAVVDVRFPAAPAAAETPPWEDVAAAAALGREHWRASVFAFESPMVKIEPEAVRYVRESFAPGRPVLAGLVELNARIRRDFAYKSGVTTVATPVSRVMAEKHGVCQDFSHAMISGLRGLGLPARYVSGYLRTKPPPGKIARRGADQSHAWVGAWMGPEHGWIDLDPTNNLVVVDEHVVLGWGRDYGDVSPVRGVLLGGGKHSVHVSVDLAPDDEDNDNIANGDKK